MSCCGFRGLPLPLICSCCKSGSLLESQQHKLAQWGMEELCSLSAPCVVQLLEKRQSHLETQQHKLAQWAMELQRREYELQVGCACVCVCDRERE